MDPLTLILVIIVIVVLLGGWQGRSYIGAGPGNALYVLGVIVLLFVLLRLLHVV